MMIQAVLGNPSHPEYGVATIPFPIPHGLLLKAGEVRKNEFEVDRAVNFHHFSSC